MVIKNIKVDVEVVVSAMISKKKGVGRRVRYRD